MDEKNDYFLAYYVLLKYIISNSNHINFIESDGIRYTLQIEHVDIRKDKIKFLRFLSGADVIICIDKISLDIWLKVKMSSSGMDGIKSEIHCPQLDIKELLIDKFELFNIFT